MKTILLMLMMLVSSTLYAQTLNGLNPGQVYTTGDLVQQTGTSGTTPWVNGVYQNSLTCWTWGDPGYCGPNAIVRPGNNINFSYGLTDLHQIVNLASVLPNTGTGLRINGYNFGFTAKNGNGWDDGRVDVLDAYVKFYDSKGNIVVNNNYNLNSKFNWTTFNYNETFTNPYATKDLSSAQFGFVGRDNNGWAGPYGPEVTNVTFSLKYSIDPCFVNVLSSPTCPGYLDALAKLAPTATTSTTETTLVTKAPDVLMPQPVQPVLSTAQSIQSTTTPATVTASQPNNTRETNSNNVSLGLSIVAKNQQREQALALQTAQNAVSATEQSAQQAQQEAVNIAMVASAASNQGLSNAARSGFLSQRQEISNNSFSTISSFSLSNSTPSNNTRSDARIQQNTFATFSEQINKENTISSLPSVQIGNVQQSQGTLPVINEFAIIDTQKLLTDRTNPITQILESRTEILTSSSTTQKTSVNTSVGDNEIASGVDITKMTVLPQGYGQYLNLVITDAAFYIPKEIYKGQKNVDNVRALRQMSSDRLHQQMINQQYK